MVLTVTLLGNFVPQPKGLADQAAYTGPDPASYSLSLA